MFCPIDHDTHCVNSKTSKTNFSSLIPLVSFGIILREKKTDNKINNWGTAELQTNIFRKMAEILMHVFIYLFILFLTAITVFGHWSGQKSTKPCCVILLIQSFMYRRGKTQQVTLFLVLPVHAMKISFGEVLHYC